MLFQLANKTYSGRLAPRSWSTSGNEANLAQLELIGIKPRLQHLGETLEELTLSFKLRVEFCNPQQELEDLETWKRDGEVLPLLLGTGQYVGDYVVKSLEKDILTAFDDGLPMDVNVEVVLLEYVDEDTEARQAQADRKKALAVGDKTQINRLPEQPITLEAVALTSVIESQNRTLEVTDLTQRMIDSPNPTSKIDDIRKKADRAQAALDKAIAAVAVVQDKVSTATGIIASVNHTKDKLTELKSLMTSPPSLTGINDSMVNVKTATRMVSDSSVQLSREVILRKI